MSTITSPNDDFDEASTLLPLLSRTGQFLQRSSVESLGAELLAWYVRFRDTNCDTTTTCDTTTAAKKAPSLRSRLNGVGRIATDCYQIFYDRSRDLWLLLLLLRLHGFTATGSNGDNDIETRKNDAVSTVVITNNINCNVVNRDLVLTLIRIMHDLRRDVSSSASRRQVLIETANALEREIDSLRVERDDLFARGSDNDEMHQQSRLIDDLQRSAERMVDLLSRSEDSIRLLVQQKTVAMERAVSVAEDDSRATFERERDIAMARITEITNEHLPQIVRIRHIVSSIEEIVERVREVISKLTRQLIDLLEHRVRQRRLLEQELQQQRISSRRPVADLVPLDKGTVRRVRQSVLRLADKQNRELSFRATRELEEYVSSLSYPTIVRSTDLRDTLQRICDTNARYALMKAIGSKRSPLYTPQSSTVYHLTRSALVAWLYLYATNEQFLDTVEFLYGKMLTVYLDQSIDALYAELPDTDKPPFYAFALMRLDLRLIPTDVFYALTRLFRLRCRRMLQLMATAYTGE